MPCVGVGGKCETDSSLIRPFINKADGGARRPSSVQSGCPAVCVILDASASRSNTVPEGCDTVSPVLPKPRLEVPRLLRGHHEPETGDAVPSDRISSVGKSAVFVRKNSRSEENSPIYIEGQTGLP